MRQTKRKIRIITAMLALFLMACGRKEQTEGGEISAERVKKGAESARNTLEKAETAETEKDSAETAENMPEKAADTAETEARGISAKGETKTTGEQEQEISDNVILAHVTENIEYTDEKIETQYTDDLSFLADLKYINGSYAYQDGKVYYRRYHEDSFGDEAKWWGYPVIPGREKEMVCIGADGTKTELFMDKGSDNIYLINGRFYMTEDGGDGKGKGEVYDTGDIIYSVDMQGNDRIDYGRGYIYDADTAEKILILEMFEQDDTAYYILDCATGEKRAMIPDIVDDYITIKDYQDGWIYYEGTNSRSPVSKVYAVSIEGVQREIIAITSEYNLEEEKEWKKKGYTEYESIWDMEVDGERLYFIFGRYGGSAGVFNRGLLVSVKLDGTDYKAVEVDDDDFYLCHDEGKTLVYFPQYNNWHQPRDGYFTIVWEVDENICRLSDFPADILYSYQKRIGRKWRYFADKGALCAVTTYDDDSERNVTDVYAIQADSDKIVRLAADIGKYAAKWEWEEEKVENIDIEYKDFYYADGFLYFKTEYSDYKYDHSFDYAYDYRRLHTDISRLKVGESEAEILYSY